MNKSKYDSVEKIESSIFKVTKGKAVKYIAVCDYGRQPKLDRKTGKMLLKQVKTELSFLTLKEARKAKADAVKARSIAVNTSGIRSKKFCDAVEDFKNSSRYRELDKSYQDHFINYINHMVDFFGEREVDTISVVDMDNYYVYQLERGNLDSAKRNKDGTVNKKEGISVNTLAKHKTGAKRIWEFMIDAKVYGVTENIVERSRIPKVEINIDGKRKKVSKVPFHPRSLTLDELNYTLNDAIQHEFDRSVAVMIGLAAIGSLRHSEVIGLQIGKWKHDEYMEISPEIWDYSCYDKELYQNDSSVIMIDTAIMSNETKFPKYNTVRVVANPEPLQKILDYAMEQRLEALKLTGRELTSKDSVYLPLINIIDGRELNSQKLSRKWSEYQGRRNKRMEKEGLEPIPHIRYHDLRHTFSDLTKAYAFEWERSYNMGHKVKGDNTTNRVYINDRSMDRRNIIKFFNENIKIDWEKAMQKSISNKGGAVYVNGSGHLVFSEAEKKRRKEQGKKCIYKEEELEQMFGME